MTSETLFAFLTYAPGPFWLLILFFPANRRAMVAVDCFLMLLAGIFFAVCLPLIPELLPMLTKPDFASIREFTGSEKGALGSWNHMILGDLWIGRWVARDTLKSSQAPQIQRLIFIPPILFFGPFGVFLYLVFRVISRRTLELSGQS